MIIMDGKLTGSRLAAKGVDVEVEVDDAVVSSIANALASTITLRVLNISNLMGVGELEECFQYALTSVLAQDSGAKPNYDPIPVFMSDLVFNLDGVYRGVRIHVSQLEAKARPSCYDTFANVLESAGVSMGRMPRRDISQTSHVMQIGLTDVNGAVAMVGTEDVASLEELVVRAMLTVSEVEQEKLNRIIGHMDNMYISRDELVRQWGTTAMSVPVTA